MAEVRDARAMRAYLRLAGMSARELAACAGLGHATVGHLLSGRRRGCSAATARAIESALGVRSGVFFNVGDTREPAIEGRERSAGAAFGSRAVRR